MATRPRWSDDDLEAVRALARTYFEREVAPNEEKHAKQVNVVVSIGLSNLDRRFQ